MYATRDGKDGLQDGIISDPRTCDFKPASLQCKAAAGPDCLTEAEVAVLDKWYAGPVTSQGQKLFPGLPMGSEPHWPRWLTGSGTRLPCSLSSAETSSATWRSSHRLGRPSRSRSSTSMEIRLGWLRRRASTMLRASTRRVVT